jgi:hypothetical protein
MYDHVTWQNYWQNYILTAKYVYIYIHIKIYYSYNMLLSFIIWVRPMYRKQKQQGLATSISFDIPTGMAFSRLSGKGQHWHLDPIIQLHSGNVRRCSKAQRQGAQKKCHDRRKEAVSKRKRKVCRGPKGKSSIK